MLKLSKGRGGGGFQVERILKVIRLEGLGYEVGGLGKDKLGERGSVQVKQRIIYLDFILRVVVICSWFFLGERCFRNVFQVVMWEMNGGDRSTCNKLGEGVTIRFGQWWEVGREEDS